MNKKVKNISPVTIFLIILGLFFIVYSEIKMRERSAPHVVTVSDAMFYHEYIAVHLYGMEPYIPREKKPVIKYTMGMAVTYMPAIAIGYLLTEIKGINHDYGRNHIYQKLFYYLGFAYCLIGFIFLSKLLKRWLSPSIIIIVLSLLFFGTNLYYYIRVEPMMSHAVSFAFITAFLYYAFRFFDKQTLQEATAMGIFLAFTTLIRPVNIIVAIIPLIYFIGTGGSHKEKFIFLKKNILSGLIIIGCVVTCFIPQLIYWHHYTGEWFYYSYRQEKFFWDKPAILQILFSFRKGWLVYTPIMFFILPGAIICYQKNKALFWSILVFTLLNIYIISCWWCWWYGGSFGMRTMIDSYGILAIWLGLFIQLVWEKSKPIFIGFICMMGFLVYVNLFQTRQARICWIHYDSMTFKAYKKIFLKNQPDEKGEEWKSYLSPPDYERAFKGERFW